MWEPGGRGRGRPKRGQGGGTKASQQARESARLVGKWERNQARESGYEVKEWRWGKHDHKEGQWARSGRRLVVVGRARQVTGCSF